MSKMCLVIDGINFLKRNIIFNHGDIRKKRDLRNACLIVVYAYDTLESINIDENNREDHLSLIINNAEYTEQLDGNVLDPDEFAPKVRESIFHKT